MSYHQSGSPFEHSKAMVGMRALTMSTGCAVLIPSGRPREQPEANPVTTDDDMVIPYLVGVGRQQQAHPGRFDRRRLTGKTQQDDAERRLAEAHDKLAKIRVLGQQEPILPHGELQHLVVAPTGISFGYVAHVVAYLPQQKDEIAITALVGQ